MKVPRTVSAAAMIAGMLVLFIIALAVNLMRGSPIDCGCFQAMEDPISWLTVVRDFIWLAMTIYVGVFDSALQLERRVLIPLKGV